MHRRGLGHRLRHRRVHRMSGPAVRRPADDLEIVTGWGRNPSTAAHVVRPTDADELALAAKAAGPRGHRSRVGAGYGDSAMNAGGLVVSSTGVSGLLDSTTARHSSVLAGTSSRPAAPHRAPRVVPAGDARHPSHHSGGPSRRCPRQDHHATGLRRPRRVAGAGPARRHPPHADPRPRRRRVLGHVRGHGPDRHRRRGDDPPASDRDQPAPRRHRSGARSRHAPRPPVGGGRRHRYSVAWVDFLAWGLWASCCSRATSPAATSSPRPPPPARERDPLAYRTMPRCPPRAVPGGVLNKGSILAFNELWYRLHPRKRRDELQSISRFFYPLDLVDGWNRCTGPGLPAMAVHAAVRDGGCPPARRRGPGRHWRRASWRCSSTSAADPAP